ncbi:MAG: bifunctional glutamate N-acetyltransferase/amino-acid acetyltransferase ArgJ [Pseudomonadota bacterium]|nr:bifunctional glutamate N-acetyltransferase/amino-acid acetyltransferase ArgJ [Pseudomonadota bacterium]
MPVGNATFPPMHPVPGFRLGTASAGIKKPGRKDLVLMAFDQGASVAACFTRNAFCAAPVQLAKAHLAAGADAARGPRYLVTNTGNANAGTGEGGLADARRVCEALAGLAGCDAEQILPYSTGVIGEPLPVDKILAALPAALAALTENGWDDAGLGIMTTDTRPKGASLRVEIAGKPVTLTGIAKGAGMIKPNMATMLGYVATDARVDNALLQEMLGRAVERSFNRITIDGDTSTNDAVTLVATGASGVAIGPGEREAFQRALDQLCRELAQAIVRDGEGATKFVTVDVAGGATSGECLAVAYAVAESPLVKTALFASDPNWGRILAAIGRAGLADLDVAGVSVHLGDVLIADKGGRAPGYTEAAGQAVMDEEEITIRIHLGRGSAHETVWTTDLSHDYVTINAEYRT